MCACECESTDGRSDCSVFDSRKREREERPTLSRRETRSTNSVSIARLEDSKTRRRGLYSPFES